MLSKKNIYRCTSLWITFSKVTFATPCWVSTTRNSHVFSFPHCFLTPVNFSCIFQGAFQLVQNISLSNFIIKNLLTFSTSPITYSFREPMPRVLPSQQNNFYTFFFFFHFTSSVANIWFQRTISFEGCTLLPLHQNAKFMRVIVLSNTLHS